jgi:hypothetical protein
MIPSVLLTALKEGFQKLINAVREVRDAVKSIKFPEQDNRQLVAAIAKVEETIRKQKPEFSGTVSVDQTQLLTALKDLRAVVSKLQLTVDLKPLLTAIKGIKLEQKDTDLSPLLNELKKIKLNVPDTFRLDDTQVARIANGGPGVSGAPLSARSVTLANVAMASANTQYSYTFPATTVAWELRMRSVDVPLLVAYTTGKLPTSGDGSAYFTVPSYYIQTNSGVDWGGKTIYLQTGSASQTLEIIVYRAANT